MPADAAKQQALEQTQAFASRPGKNFVVGPVCCQPSSIGEELLPGNVAWVVISNDNTPLLLWHPARPRADLAGGADLFASLVATKYVGAGVRWIGEHAEKPRMGQPAPDQLAVPDAAVRPTRKQKSALMEALNNAVSGALLLKQFE